MNFIVAGGGAFGRRITQKLADEGHDVVVIELNKEIAEELSEELNATIICGSASDPKILEKAGLEEADKILSVTSEDQTNLLACLFGKMKGNLETIARVKNPAYVEIFKKLGIDRVIYPEEAAADYLKEELTKKEAVGIEKIKEEDAMFAQFKIESKKLLGGKQLRNIEWPWGCLPIGIYRNNNFIIPQRRDTFKKGDELLLIVKKESIGDLRKFMKS